MKVPLPTLDDLPQNKANCATCTRKGGACPRDKNIKSHGRTTQHNGLFFNEAGDCFGMIAGCMNYTGQFAKIAK